MKQFILRFVIALGLIANIKSENKENVTARVELDYTTSIAGMARLLTLDKELIDNLDRYGDLLERRINLIDLYLDNLNAEHKKVNNDPETYLSNPLNSFSLIRRMHEEWTKWHEHMKIPIGQENIDFIENLRLKLPSDEDMEEAKAGFFRIQTTYQLKIPDMAAGILNGKKYDAEMDVLECLTIGEYFSEKRLHNDALMWFVTGLHYYKEEFEQIYAVMGISRAVVWYKIADKFSDLSNNKAALSAIDNALHFKPNDPVYKKFKKDLINQMKFTELCRGRNVRRRRSKNLHCRYNSTASFYLTIGPVKMEEISRDPYIVIYHDIIYDREMKHLREEAIPNLRKTFVSEDRILKSAYIPYKNYTKIMFNLEQRISDFSGLEKEGPEPLHISNYGIGGEYYNHFGFFEDEKCCEIGTHGNRYAMTYLVLSDIDDGGATVFPALDLSIHVKKGSALFIQLLDNAGKGDERTLHGNCPVIVGSNWWLVKIVRHAPLMFKQKCYK